MKYIHVMKLPVKIICHEKFRSLLSLAHDRANMISRHADRFARELRHEPGYERIIYMPGIKLESVRSDLYTEKRGGFDIDGRLFLLNENGAIIDIHGYETDGYGMPVLPDHITVNDLFRARQQSPWRMNFSGRTNRMLHNHRRRFHKPGSRS
ncbi:hypothetical protein M9472_003296 [Salmonella enterica]|nr:hypothetical protein [Salmonella enterica]EJG3989069.1 hypothetical protein [Salmonella enterica]